MGHVSSMRLAIHLSQEERCVHCVERGTGKMHRYLDIHVCEGSMIKRLMSKREMGKQNQIN